MNNNKGQSWGFTGECPKDFKNSEENVTVHTAELYLIPNKKIWYAMEDGQKKTSKQIECNQTSTEQLLRVSETKMSLQIVQGKN